VRSRESTERADFRGTSFTEKTSSGRDDSDTDRIALIEETPEILLEKLNYVH